MSIPLELRRSIRRRLLAWYDRNRRNLPWRRTRDAYRIWLSEMMLQQTQVATVIPYYRRFLRAFPNVRRLAAAPQDRVLSLWAGLGYYARARNLHRAARRVVADFGGRFPETVESLRELPGVGPYSAAAVASMAFDRRAAVLDGNVRRVLSRLFAARNGHLAAQADRDLLERAGDLLPTRRSGDFNQALMELGATVCLPGAAARCTECPLLRHCRAAASGRVGRIPPRRSVPDVRTERHVVAAVRRNGKWLAVRRADHGLWGGLWELPSRILEDGAAADCARSIGEQWTGAPCTAARSPFCRLERKLTHRLVRFVGYEIACVKGPPRRANRDRRKPSASRRPCRWLTLPELHRLPLSTAMKEVLARLEAQHPPDRRRQRQASGA